jgi:hypothetical protein
MPKTFIDFVPSQIQAPQFNLTLDGNTYTAVITWNLFAQRYYITILSLEGTVIVTEALVGSPIPIAISSVSWANGKAIVRTAAPHGLRFAQSAIRTISGMAPDAYNGTFQVFAIDRSTFSFPLAANPGAATGIGAVENNINLVAGLFTSTLVFRAANNQFEVT